MTAGKSIRLVIVSHVVHYYWDGGYYAYSPYAKEIEMWADLFPSVVIAAPLRNAPPPCDTCLLDRPNIRVSAQKEVGGERWRDKGGIILALPALVVGLSKELLAADVVHVRCPGNLGLLGTVLAPLFSRCMIAKYAGQWNGFPGEELTVRLQRFLLRSRWWRGPVTVYGKTPGQKPHVIDFFSSMFTAEQLSRARACASSKSLGAVRTVAFAGRLSRAKNVDVLLRAIAMLRGEGIPMKAVIVGDGPERSALEALTRELGISGSVAFTGAVAPEEVPDHLERADVFVLASHSEGWPKSIAEAMAFGLVCIGSDVGLIRMFLSEGRGITVPPRDVDALAGAIRKVATAPRDYEAMRALGSAWAQKYSLEGLRDALRELMAAQWERQDVRRVLLSGLRQPQS